MMKKFFKNSTKTDNDDMIVQGIWMSSFLLLIVQGTGTFKYIFAMGVFSGIVIVVNLFWLVKLSKKKMTKEQDNA
ncbi:hypothetical protein [Pseudolactococcus chungangensis]|jgi:hypothetical protein|uniref:hypothetical protein n=1 Tax=Pseudolactococcus chungangensis TaxID=451457 RepID=UPI0028D83531|nr:hypothetical protein [Lactococcus chungangensis]